MQSDNPNQSLNIILCLAGKGQRFVDQGYTIPKFLLRDISNAESILELIIKNFAASGVKNFFLILNLSHQKWEAEIKESISKFTNLDFSFLFISDTSGQAETAYHGVKHIKKKRLLDLKDPIGFHNGDTILLNRNINLILKGLQDGADGAIDTFPASSQAYSYVKICREDTIIEIKEKQVISNMASSGLYIFQNLEVFLTYYEKTAFLNKEKYISQIYQTMLMSQSIVLNLYNNRKQDTVILGTPDEYERWKENG